MKERIKRFWNKKIVYERKETTWGKSWTPIIIAGVFTLCLLLFAYQLTIDQELKQNMHGSIASLTQTLQGIEQKLEREVGTKQVFTPEYKQQTVDHICENQDNHRYQSLINEYDINCGKTDNYFEDFLEFRHSLNDCLCNIKWQKEEIIHACEGDEDIDVQLEIRIQNITNWHQEMKEYRQQLRNDNNCEEILKEAKK